ncbi:hypothetical protein HRR83_006400 [Exophiala dermatitidis]|uniref:Uncharacterized protein n=1 Tax=Exophiala dermatitidis TaxID=5970 RepID=A0AAN6IS54_EXODE|nr:hypothetical protein HRR73_007258 [Exophiala dermatitidis]KAJ4509591.1 hypothetical protein HRR74_007372 [Exophiala dermatitidis]KAJ4530598.1 hypothetical protein HRR76_008299 [Exophiala dermatitidis]KAJ4545233.1 hypothetical protein HRR77_005088 [Exophiala dermatitidis]KAJ4570792.1 hypothetical protein HRR79_003729 [Exophiala dermatitidis]
MQGADIPRRRCQRKNSIAYLSRVIGHCLHFAPWPAEIEKANFSCITQANTSHTNARSRSTCYTDTPHRFQNKLGSLSITVSMRLGQKLYGRWSNVSRLKPHSPDINYLACRHRHSVDVHSIFC